MKRAKPSDLRRAMEAARILMQQGVLFVPMPVLNNEDCAALMKQVEERLDKMIGEDDETVH